MRRLLLPTLLGVFCLALLVIPANAGLYDPHNPPPTPYININDLNNDDTGWDGPIHSGVGDQNLDEPMTVPSETISERNLKSKADQISAGNTIKRRVISIILRKISRW